MFKILPHLFFIFLVSCYGIRQPVLIQRQRMCDDSAIDLKAMELNQFFFTSQAETVPKMHLAEDFSFIGVVWNIHCIK